MKVVIGNPISCLILAPGVSASRESEDGWDDDASELHFAGVFEVVMGGAVDSILNIELMP